MRRGFTILELLVAALLLGMLVTVLTMVFVVGVAVTLVVFMMMFFHR